MAQYTVYRGVPRPSVVPLEDAHNLMHMMKNVFRACSAPQKTISKRGVRVAKSYDSSSQCARVGMCLPARPGTNKARSAARFADPHAVAPIVDIINAKMKLDSPIIGFDIVSVFADDAIQAHVPFQYVPQGSVAYMFCLPLVDMGFEEMLKQQSDAGVGVWL